MTTKDELWALGLLLTLAAMLYLAAWLIDGSPGSREEPSVAPAETVLPLGQAPVLNHRPD